MKTAARELKDLMLQKPRLTLAVAESLTAGHVQSRIAAVSGASEFFLGGLTAYSLEQKVQHLGVNEAEARVVNCVSAQVAEQMARGTLKLFGSDLAVATTGYAEPSPKDGAEAPFAWWALAWRQKKGKPWLRHGCVECYGSKRVEVQSIVAEAALAELIAWLREVRG
jgi:nicotinamide-nucleotide amidase